MKPVTFRCYYEQTREERALFGEPERRKFDYDLSENDARTFEEAHKIAQKIADRTHCTCYFIATNPGPRKEMSTNEQGCLVILLILGMSLAFGILASLAVKVLEFLNRINII